MRDLKQRVEDLESYFMDGPGFSLGHIAERLKEVEAYLGINQRVVSDDPPKNDDDSDTFRGDNRKDEEETNCLFRIARFCPVKPGQKKRKKDYLHTLPALRQSHCWVDSPTKAMTFATRRYAERVVRDLNEGKKGKYRYSIEQVEDE